MCFCLEAMEEEQNDSSDLIIPWVPSGVTYITLRGVRSLGKDCEDCLLSWNRDLA